MDLIATRPLTYGTRRLKAGDPFTASRTNGRVLVAINKAKLATEKDAAPEEKASAAPARRRSPKRKDG